MLDAYRNNDRLDWLGTSDEIGTTHTESASLVSNMLPEILRRAASFELRLNNPEYPYDAAVAAFGRLESLWATLQQTANPFDLAAYEPAIQRLDLSLARSRARLQELAPRRPWWQRLLDPLLELASAVASLLGFRKLGRNEGENQLDFQAACTNYQSGRTDFKIGVTVPASGGKPARTLELFRAIYGISRYSDLVETAQNGSQSLTSATFDKLVALAAEVNKSLADQQAAEPHHGARPDAG